MILKIFEKLEKLPQFQTQADLDFSPKASNQLLSIPRFSVIPSTKIFGANFSQSHISKRLI